MKSFLPFSRQQFPRFLFPHDSSFSPTHVDTREEKCGACNRPRLFNDRSHRRSPIFGAKPSKNPDYKVTNTIFLPTGRSGLETLRFLTAALIKIRNPRFHGSRCTREPVQHTPRNFTANYSFNSKRGERESLRQKRLNLRRNPSCCLLVGQLCCA